jgi:hypothetical protein
LQRSLIEKELILKVPFLDLKIQYKEIEQEVVPMVTDVMANGAFVGGPQVSGFETEFAKFCNSNYCVGVNSGTDALRFALIAIGVGPGDEVITVPNTFIATTEAISQVGAKPVFVDIDPDTCNIDPNKLNDYLKFRNPQSAIRNPQSGTGHYSGSSVWSTCGYGSNLGNCAKKRHRSYRRCLPGPWCKL